MMRRLVATLAAGVAVLTMGCAAAPTRFYLLSPVGGTAAPERAAGVVAVGPVSLPDYLDRPQIVTRDGANAAQLGAYDQWAGPLDDMLPRVLAEDLAARLPGDRVVVFPRTENPAFDHRVAVDVSRFDVDETGSAILSASWQVVAPAGKKPLLVRESTVRATAASASYDDRVAALSQALGLLADDIAQGLASLR